MSECKHDMDTLDDSTRCVWCGESELDIVKAELKALRKAAQAVVDAGMLAPEGDYYYSEVDHELMDTLASLLTKEEL